MRHTHSARMSGLQSNASSMAKICVATGLMLGLALASSAASAADRTKPTTPGSLRVVGKTAYTVTLAWNPSTDNSGNFNYHLWGAYGVPAVVLPRTATSYTYTGLFPGNTYTFGIFARDAAGNNSGQANLSGIRLPSDTTPPTTAPVVSVSEAGANYAVISWTPAQDDGPHLSTQIFLNGALYAGVGRGVTTATLRFLQPATSYSLSARAVDFGNNRGPIGSPIDLTTPPPNPADTMAPLKPVNLNASGTGDGSTETHLSWTQSADNFDASANIRYDVYVNGVVQDIRFGSGRSIFYSEFGTNLIEVTATDSSGNVSEAASTTITF